MTLVAAFLLLEAFLAAGFFGETFLRATRSHLLRETLVGTPSAQTTAS